MILKIQIQYKFVESALILTLAQSAKTFGTKEELEVRIVVPIERIERFSLTFDSRERLCAMLRQRWHDPFTTVTNCKFSNGKKSLPAYS